MANTIKLKRGTSTPSTSDISSGEVAIDTSAQKLYINDSGTVKEIGGGGSSIGGNTGVDFNDNVKVRFGTGNDFEIFHDGSTSRLHSASDSLYIRTGNIFAVYDGAGNEEIIRGIQNGAVELYYDNSKKLETTSEGIRLNDSVKAAFGTDGDLKIYHNGTAGKIEQPTGTLWMENSVLALTSSNGSEYMAKFTENSSVDLYYDNVKTFATEDNGAYIYGPEGGIAQLMLYADEGDDNPDKWRMAASASASQFNLYNFNDGAWETSIECNGSGNVELYFDNSKKFETTSAGVRSYGILQTDSYINIINGADLYLADNGKANFGDSTDLEIFHDGSDSYIKEDGTGELQIWSNTNLALRSDSFRLNNAANNENMVKADADGSVELYYDNSKKLYTESDGIAIDGSISIESNGYLRVRATDSNGSTAIQLGHDGTASFTGVVSPNTHVDMPDDAYIKLGTGDDLQIYHDGSFSRIKDTHTNALIIQSSETRVQSEAADETMATFVDDGAVSLYYDNVKKLETNSEAVMIHGITRIQGAESTDAILILQADEADEFDDYWKLVAKTNGDFAIENIRNTLGWETNLTCTGNGSVDLYYDNFKTLKTISNGITLYGPEGTGCTLHMYPDDGDDNADKWMIQANESGYWYIKNKASGSWETNIETVGNSHVGLYYDNSLKFYTQSTKNVSAGHFYPESNNTYDLGHSSYRWNNIYVNDMHFSNEGKSNSVDGTWGDWTLQEGDENIFMINNRTGKKYKMGLVEVA